HPGDTDSRTDYLSLALLGRELADDERVVVNNAIAQFHNTYTSHSSDAEALLVDDVNPTYTIHPTEKHDAAELATWTMITSQLMNLDESLTKN
ncbi:MAG: hypothetical protein AAF226_03045, partial [Verrucomicrobiota bacterium]